MRNIITTTFVTMDGVVQAPGGPEEDTSGGFTHGGWTVNYWDNMMAAMIDGFMKIPFELLLGRKTYDIFAAYWPKAEVDLAVAEPFNKTRKYVVSHNPLELSWYNSTSISGDVEARIRQLKEENGPDLWVHGSGNLIQTLLKGGLIDRMHLWMFPVTIGNGKRLFAEGTKAEGFKLIDSRFSTTGVTIATYESTGALKSGNFDLVDESHPVKSVGK